MKPYKAIGFCFVLSISFRRAERYCRCHLFSLRLPCPRRQTSLCTTLFPYGYPGFARVCAAVQKKHLPNQNNTSRIRTTILESEQFFQKNTKHFHKTIKHIKRDREKEFCGKTTKPQNRSVILSFRTPTALHRSVLENSNNDFVADFDHKSRLAVLAYP